MKFEITRVSIMDIEGVDDEAEAQAILQALSENTEGMSMTFQQRPITYVEHVKTTAALRGDREAPSVNAGCV